jgi:hypothetical protein
MGIGDESHALQRNRYLNSARSRLSQQGPVSSDPAWLLYSTLSSVRQKNASGARPVRERAPLA